MRGVGINWGVTMGLNVIKMDSKGRISIPFFLRNLLEIDYGDQLILKMNEKKEITATPIAKDGNTRISSVNGLGKIRYPCLARSK
jgi:bifunctional DNA-binding transcriptional regulator/antitoxin component of YhaV-PrlF toxin-antitoxin module